MCAAYCRVPRVMDMLAGAEQFDAKNIAVLRDYNPVYHSRFRTMLVVGFWRTKRNFSGVRAIFPIAKNCGCTRARSPITGGEMFRFGDESIITEEAIFAVYGINSFVTEVNGRRFVVID